MIKVICLLKTIQKMQIKRRKLKSLITPQSNIITFDILVYIPILFKNKIQIICCLLPALIFFKNLYHEELSGSEPLLHIFKWLTNIPLGHILIIFSC